MTETDFTLARTLAEEHFRGWSELAEEWVFLTKLKNSKKSF